MNKSIATILLTVLAVVSLTNGCATRTPTLPGESLEWELVVQRIISSDYEETFPLMETIVTIDQVPELGKFLLSPHIELMYDIDFDVYIVAVIFYGERMTTGYSIEVLDVRQDGNMIVVYAKLLTPPTPAPGEIVGVGEMVTSPYCVLRITKTPQLEGDFTFVLIADGEEVSRQQHVVL